MLSRCVRLLIACSLLAAALLASCDEFEDQIVTERITGSGNVVTQTRSVGSFDRILLSGQGTVIVTQGAGPVVTIETDDDLMDYLTTEVRGSTLELGTSDEARNKSLEPSRDIVWNVETNTVAGLELAGAGAFDMDRLDADGLTITLSGAGDIRIDALTAADVAVRLRGAGNVTLAGSVESQDVELSGAGNYEGANLESRRADVALSGSGNIEVWASDALDLSLTGTGNIAYFGSPTISQSVTGVGSIEARGDR